MTRIQVLVKRRCSSLVPHEGMRWPESCAFAGSLLLLWGQEHQTWSIDRVRPHSSTQELFISLLVIAGNFWNVSSLRVSKVIIFAPDRTAERREDAVADWLTVSPLAVIPLVFSLKESQDELVQKKFVQHFTKVLQSQLYNTINLKLNIYLK